ncbi:hypothetical protein [Candidatus Formimonas warabiya]|uniref:Uncharacterized protein n=1 Tax=Formimonas warabiya TaxID=1761012 RepID=A0A3G1KPN7_FORW1|nr:hypothetical protein [Candidatus Formimonas warabiya]ATW24421.1 hypothetical protein DCMF_06145 [Candidatus Formimonas warabiya]
MKKVSKMAGVLLVLIVALSIAGCGGQEDKPSQTAPEAGAGNRPGGLENVITASVTAGIITQETADKITAYQEEHRKDLNADREKVESMTDEEEKAYFEKRERNDPLTEWLTAGLITEDQANQMREIMPKRQPAPGEQGADTNTNTDANTNTP